MKYYLNNSYNQMQAASGGQVSLLYPEKLYLDITHDCNIYCQMCRDKVEITGKTMPYDLFRRIVDETSPYIKSYSLFNSGEPLIVDDFCERVDYVHSIKRDDCRIEISTNGMLLTDDIIGFLRAREVSVIVSFDGADKEIFEKIRRGASFERVCGNLQKLSAAYSDIALHKSPQIYVTLQKDNQAQLLKIAELAYSLGVRSVGFGLVNSPSAYAPDNLGLLKSQIESTSRYLDACKMLNGLYPTRVGDYLWWGSSYTHMDNFILDNRCTAPFVSAAVRYNGDICLCCNIGERVDSVIDKSFLEVWQSSRFDILRESVNSSSTMPERCKHCWWSNRA